MGRGTGMARDERGGGATQLVVAIVFIGMFFSFGPWFAGKIGPGLADLITDLAQPPAPCPTASAEPTEKPRKNRVDKRQPGKDDRTTPRRGRTVGAGATKRPRPSATPTSTCAPVPSESSTPSTRAPG